MITSAQIYAAFRSWLSTATGLTVIHEQAASTGPRPGTTYVTVKLLAIRQVGWDDYGELTDPLGPPAYGTMPIRGDRVLTASINVIGPNAVDKARDAMNDLNKETVRDQFRAAKIAIRRVTAYDDLTGLFDTEWEPRVHFDQEFAIADNYTDSIAIIEHVEGTAEFITPSGTIEEPFTIN